MSEPAEQDVDAAETRTHAGAAVAPIAAAQSLGRYQILSVAGTGGMGRVYAAFDPQLDRRVALKVVHTKEDASHQQRASREAKALARLSHPNVVAIHEVTEHEGELLIAMEFVTGQTLKAWMVEHPPSGKRQWLLDALDVLIQAGRGLAAAHEAKLVHRDFKPSNVLVGDDGRVRVVDFGLARDVLAKVGAKEAGGTASSGESSRGQITKTGAVVGTPAYMAPEQTTGEGLDERTDQYAFCVTAWEVLYGRRPGESEPTSKQGAASNKVDKALRKGLSKSPDGRFGKMGGLLALLEAEREVLLGRRPVRRWRWAAFAVSPLLVYGGVVLAGKAAKERELAECSERAGVIDEVWNTARRSELETELRATSHGTDAYVGGVVERIDAYVESWRGNVREGCNAAIDEERWTAAEREAVEWCLDERRAEFEAFIGSLEGGGEVAAQAAPSAAGGLQPSEACLDPSGLPDLPPLWVRDEAVFVRLRVDLSRAQALAEIGQWSAAEDLSREALRSAQDLAWDPLVAEARLVLHDATLARPENEPPMVNLRAAYIEATRSESWLIAADAAVEIARTERKALRFDDGLYWTDLASAALDLAGGERELRRARVATARCGLLALVDRFEEAFAAGRRAVDGFERLLGLNHPVTAIALEELAFAHEAKGQHDEALRLFERTLEIRRKTSGPRSSSIALTYERIGKLYVEKSEFPLAKQHLERALEISRETDGPDSFNAAIKEAHLARAHLGMGETAVARDLLQHSLEVQVKIFGAGNASLIGMLSLVATANEEAGDLESAEELLREAVAIAEAQSVGAKMRSNLFVRIGKFRTGQKDLEGMLQAYDRALEVVVEELGPEHREIAFVQNNRGFGLHQLGKSEEGLVFVSEALELHQRIVSDRDMECSSMRSNLGQIHSALGNFEKALEEFERAQKIRLEFVKESDALAQEVPKFIADLCAEKRYEPACSSKIRAADASPTSPKGDPDE